VARVKASDVQRINWVLIDPINGGEPWQMELDLERSS